VAIAPGDLPVGTELHAPPLRDRRHQRHSAAPFRLDVRRQERGQGAGVGVVDLDAQGGAVQLHRQRRRRPGAHVSDDIGDEFAHAELRLVHEFPQPPRFEVLPHVPS
jgi:hypothetical protein